VCNVPYFIQISCQVRAGEHCFLSQTLDRASYQSYCPNISCKMAGLAETWSNIEVRSVIRFLRLNGTLPAEIHRQLVEVTIRRKWPGLLRRGVVLHDNARPHTQPTARRYNWEVLDHPPYSPDLAPSDFNLFGPLKKHLGGRRFATDGEVQQAVMS
jgi:histone-lysine N-methyltransferase SETMAR